MLFVYASMTEDLGELADVLEGATVIRVARMGLDQLFERGWLFPLDDKGVEQVNVGAHTQRSLEHCIIGLLHYDLEVRAIQVHVEEGHPLVGSEHGAEVGELVGVAQVG